MSARRDTVGIVGAGSFGVALAHVVASDGRPVMIWSMTRQVVDEINRDHATGRFPGLSLPATIRATDDPAALAAAARFVVLAVSSSEARGRLAALGDALDGSHLVVHAIGALSAPGDVYVSEVIREETPVLRLGAVAGPALPKDLLDGGRVASMVCASDFAEVTSEARRLLNVNPKLRLYRGSDLKGVELASALSGAYTIALAMADTLEVGIGSRAVLVTRALAEMSRLVGAVGGEERTVRGLAGLGNLLVRAQTEGDHQSPSYAYGRDLAGGGAPRGRVPEGARAALAGHRLARRLGERVPLLAAIVSVIEGSASAQQAAAAILETVAEEE